MLDFDLIKIVLVVSVASSIICTATVQKIKEGVKTKKYLWIISLAVSLIIGTLFALCFSELSLVNCLWVGLISWIGAGAIYSAFEDKIFTPFSKMQEVVEVPKNQIKTLDDLGSDKDE